MIDLRQEQIKEKVNMAVEMVGADLTQFKGTFGIPSKSSGNLLTDDLSPIILRTQTIGQRFGVSELEEKIRNAFRLKGLDKLNFEFAVATITRRTTLM